MIRLLLLLLLLVVGLVAGPLLVGQKGYVLIAMDTLTIEMTVVSLGLLVFFSVIGFLFVEWLIKKLYRWLSGSTQWFGAWTERKQRNAFYTGLQAMAENNPDGALLALEKTRDRDFAGINLLALADLYRRKGEHKTATACLQEACAYPGANTAARLTLARLALQRHDSQAALDELDKIDEKQQRQGHVLNLRAQAMAEGGHWQELQSNLKSWKKYLGNDYEYWMQQASVGTFSEIASKEGANSLKQRWQALPRATRKDPAQQAAYIQQLLDQGMHTDAENALVEYQKNKPHPVLVEQFRQLKLPNPTKALKSLEGWLKVDPDNIDLLSVLGQVAYNANELRLAEQALGKAVKLGNRRQDILLLAAIRESQQDEHQALSLYKQTI
ncbi:heme biosynthesis HemY N-terminal domain-containing protein [Aestuariibacter salexigens]|uniref:heme biosynthesis HemY N-terminal domain-containing protein n=1 Tax=Aestuariibacter salexigens TaxID=226010 RepID=UPI0004019550|nr:heme biosynthesis HemY N-terminal domain-containing protein [Aestuariibacter salexigens]